MILVFNKQSLNMKTTTILKSAMILIMCVLQCSCHKDTSNPKPTAAKKSSLAMILAGTWNTVSDTLSGPNGSTVHSGNFGNLLINAVMLTNTSADSLSGTFTASRGSGTYFFVTDAYNHIAFLVFTFSTKEQDVYGLDSVSPTTFDMHQNGISNGVVPGYTLPDPYGSATLFSLISQQMTLQR
jgi:hypothetical protein